MGVILPTIAPEEEETPGFLNEYLNHQNPSYQPHKTQRASRTAPKLSVYHLRLASTVLCTLVTTGMQDTDYPTGIQRFRKSQPGETRKTLTTIRCKVNPPCKHRAPPGIQSPVVNVGASQSHLPEIPSLEGQVPPACEPSRHEHNAEDVISSAPIPTSDTPQSETLSCNAP